MRKRLNLSLINENLLYKVLSIPSFSEKEYRMQDFLLEYSRQKGITASMDGKGNIYLCKGSLTEGHFYPCVTAHMDTLQERQIPYIEANKPIPLLTEKMDGKHIIHADGFGLGGDDKAGIVIALTIMENLKACKAVFFVEEENGCGGSTKADLRWFKDVGYIMAFDSPEGNCASWSCNGIRFFDREFYETYLEEGCAYFGLTKFVAHPYTDVLVLRADTSLACMNFGAGYYEYHTLQEYVVPEEMDNAAAMGIYLIGQLGTREYVIPYASRYKMKEDPDYDYFLEKFKQ